MFAGSGVLLMRLQNLFIDRPNPFLQWAACKKRPLCLVIFGSCTTFVWRKPSLTPKMFKIQKNLCAVLSQTTSGEACAHDNRTKREKERPERAVSPQPRATPWVSTYKRLRPVRAKVWANGWLLLLPLQGVGNGGHDTQGVALGCGLVGLSARARPQIGFHAQSLSI